MELKLSNCISNTKQLNGWNYDNEKIFNSLTWKEKEAVNLLLIEQFKFFNKNERISFIDLVGIVKKNKTVIHLTDEMISKVQMKLLWDEVKAINNVSTS
jgi:hypothetical protein